MAFKKPQITKVKSDIQSLSIYLRSVKKFGKSTLFRDIVLEKFGSADRGLLVGIGDEMGYNILDNLNATQAESWEDLDELKDWLINEKGNEHNIEMVAFDVIDELMPLAEDEICRLSRRETGKPCKSFNSAFGGYGEPRKRLKRLVKNYFSDLRKAGIQPFAISHVSVKSIKEKGDDTEGYNVLTSNLSNDYEAIFGDIFDCVLTGYIDRSVDGTKVTSEMRKLYFRGNGFIDAGCRFGDGTVPEYIPFDKPNMAKTVIDVLEEGLRKSRTDVISKEEFNKEQQVERRELENKHEEFKADKAKEDNVVEGSTEIKTEKLEKIKANIASLDMSEVQPIMQKHSIKDFSNIEVIPMECLDQILALI